MASIAASRSRRSRCGKTLAQRLLDIRASRQMCFVVDAQLSCGFATCGLIVANAAFLDQPRSLFGDAHPPLIRSTTPLPGHDQKMS
jgi:hypothetical protein